ncbi:MAG: enoyl-CoA hydratase/isomerase family protein [Vicinamibacterales bacterium]
MSTDHTRFDIDGVVATLTFNRPQARNAMTWAMYDALVEACDRVDARGDVRAFVLRGAGDKAFVAGTDIGQFTSFGSQEAAIAYERRIDSVIDRLEQVRVPTIAQVHGVAAGGGCAIAFACDLRVCTPEARFGVPIARTLGNCLSAANYARLVDLIGPARTKELLFTGRYLDAAEAERIGIVNRIVERPELERTVAELTSSIAANAPLTIRATKEAVRRIQVHRRLEAHAADDLVALCYTSADFREGVEAFLAGRPPHFQGQ